MSRPQSSLLDLLGSNRIGSLSKNVFERRKSTGSGRTSITSTGSGRASIPVDMRSSKTLLIKFLIRGRKLLAFLSWCPAPCFPSLWQQHLGTSQALYFRVYSYQAVWYWVLLQRPLLLCHLESSLSVLTAGHWYLIWHRLLYTATLPHAWL